MRMRSAVLAAVLLSATVAVSAQGSLTAQDRADMQELTARYARALGACAAEDTRISSPPTPATSPVTSGARSSDAIG